MCRLPLKSLADRETSGSARRLLVRTLGTTNGHFCPGDEIIGDRVDMQRR